jgi:glucose-fructose oxidoreductase
MKGNRIWRVAGISFEHFHIGDLLKMAFEHPRAEIVGICDEQPARMQSAIRNFGIPPQRVFTDYRACMEKAKPDVVILCPATARHAWFVEKVAPYGADLIVEKPFAATLREADRMIAAARAHRVKLAINWPLRWVPAHVTAHRLLSEGMISDLQEVHYYGGNRGPLRHGVDKVEAKPGPKAKSWFYQRKAGGGSLLDYLGYGTTLGTWYHNGAKPLEVMCMMDEPRGLEVDEQSITVARYRCGLSQFETRWGTFTDPWTHQPQPKCGFVLKGTRGTISSYDYEPTVRVQTERRPEGFDQPADKLKAPFANPIQYFIHCLETGAPVAGPLSPAISRIGQQIVDAAVLSARKKQAVKIS